jgi:hypothetical protein
MFIVVDSNGIKVSRHIFQNREQAETFKIMSQRYDLKIKEINKLKNKSYDSRNKR